MRPNINKDLLPIKAHYFLFNAGTAPVVPFMPTLAKQLGYSSIVVGTMYTILAVIGMLTKPLVGFLSDRYQRHRMLFISCEILTGLAFFLITFTPGVQKPLPVVELHHESTTTVRYCSSDNCISTNLKNHFQNQTLTCKLHCQIEPFIWNDMCKECFQIKPENCNRSSEYVDLIRDINMNDIGMDQLTDGKTCMIFTVIQPADDLEALESTDCLDNSTYFNTTCELNCNNEYLHSQLAESPVISNSDAVSLYQFWWFFGMLTISWIGMAAVVSIGDAICFAILGERGHLYGKQRLYGSVGWGIFSILAGILVDSMSTDTEKDYTAVFWMTAIIMALDVLASIKLKHTQTHLSPNILKDVGQMFLSMRCVIFFIWCVFIGLGTALIWNFLFWHLENLSSCQDSMKTLQGFVMAIQCFCGELPFFFSSGWILKKIGHINAMSLVLFGFGVRFILYSMLQDPWYVLPIELLNGVTFGLFYATMASYASIVAPPGTETTMQGLVGAIFEGIGVSTGSFVGGLLFDSVGGGHTFEIFGVSFFIAFIVHFCIQKYLQRHQSADTDGKQSSEQNSKDSINHINNPNSATRLTKDIAPTDTVDKIQNDDNNSNKIFTSLPNKC
ncbi:major facilitator superfamily domain-containing protein 6-A isoform X1 [Glossina fuscipes]|uniref:Major facilitator superfamily domain-containing protein 6-A isoform X1 n=2 Tax=Glossina fuscipes TaxID=7396 RepID=A0A8U0W3Y3_9MUSC|nr:major facilitator superfamily domain-containing protein 6-A isoform X1 [Glossina fuscipes]XP_037879819.1 major facilitator superfamily domain-containing protein 6-A isoform X1 [Glossina fuscipes]